jgi:DnaJ-class molecular chaperone
MSGWRKRGHGVKPDDLEEDYEDEICSGCSGSGEGMYYGSNCYNCKGSGIEPVECEDDDYA